MTFRTSRIYRVTLLVGVALIAAPVGSTLAQMAPTDLLMRIEALERQLRVVTGTVEQLQYRNQQLEQQLRQVTEQNETRAPDSVRGAMRPLPPQQRPGAIPPPSNAMPPAVPAPSVAAPMQSPPVQQGGRRSDAFDPSANPNAPGVPQPLGGRRSEASEPPYQTGATAMPRGNDSMTTIIASEDPRAGNLGGREPGAPLDLSGGGGGLRVPQAPRDTLAPGNQVATLPPSQTPRDEYDLAYGYFLRKDYALAEEGLREFMQKYPRDRMVPDAQFWVGESMFQRQNYREAADAFVAMTKKYENHNKAPDALLRLGQSLAALNERELACATFGEVTRKYPRAAQRVKEAAEREQKRARC
jgi:tol-pal system protein YbgF